MGKRRIGRPPASAGQDDTRERILLAAREEFSRLGYRAAALHDIANAADITTGAIYHHFDSKQALFGAVCEDVTRRVFAEFESVVSEGGDIADQLCAIFDAASKLHENDRTLARFSAISAIELQRHPELVDVVGPEGLPSTASFFAKVARRAGDNGELPEGLDGRSLGHMLVAVTLGLAQFGALVDSTAVHRRSVAALEFFVRAALPGDD